MANKMTLEEFGKTIKAKYPQYGQMSDEELGKMVVKRYPQYQSMILDEPKAETKPIEQKKSIGRKVVDFFTSSEQGFGKTLGAAASVIDPSVKKNREAALKTQMETVDMAMNKAKAEKDPVKKKRYLELAQNAAKQEGIDIYQNPEYQKTAKQILGEAVGVVADIASFGTYGVAAKGAKAGQVLVQGSKSAKVAETLSKAGVKATQKVTTPVAKTGGKAFIQGAVRQGKTGAAIGAGYGTSNAMQENASVGDIVKSTATGAVVGGVLSGVTGGVSERSTALAPQRATKLQEKAVAQYQKALGATKEKYKQMGDKIIPSLLKDNVWGTRRNLILKAEKGIVLSQDEYAKLGELEGVAKIGGIIEKLQKEMSKLKAPDGRVLSSNTTRFKALQELEQDVLAYQIKDAATSNPVAYQEGLRQLRAQYDALTYGTKKAITTVEESQKLGPIKELADDIRRLLNTDNPDFATINKVMSTNSRLRDILVETARRKQSQSWIGLIDASLSGKGGLTGALVGALAGGVSGAVSGAAAVGGTVLALNKIMNSTWWNTMRAVQKSNAATKLIKMSPEIRNKWIIYISRKGSDGIQKLLNEKK